MSGFSADWLSLREPFDAAARSTALIAELRRQLPPGTADAPLHVIDLGAGAGSNFRYLAPLLGGVQHWRLVDHDRRLLTAAVKTTRAWARARGADAHGATWLTGKVLTLRAADFAARVRCERRDLSAHPVTIPFTDLEIPTGALVTASALLDLVANDWLNILASRCKAARAAACFALSYDGRTFCTPVEPEDAEVLALFNRHQLGDKGFGAALGPRAAAATEAAFTVSGYRTAIAPSDWDITPDQQAMQKALLDGWLGTAVELAPQRSAELTAWHERRVAHVTAGRSRLRVGHVDLVAWLD